MPSCTRQSKSMTGTARRTARLLVLPGVHAGNRTGQQGILCPHATSAIHFVDLMGRHVLDPQAIVRAFPEFALQLPALGVGGFKIALRGQAVQDVVLKLPTEPLPQDTDDEDVQEVEALLGERFRREVEAMRSIRSDRVVRILRGPETRAITGRDYLWYLEPYYPSTLARELAAGRTWTLEQVVDLLDGILEGVGVLADHGLVHRDIKPENIALDWAGLPVLLDLGAALFLNLPTVTLPNQLAPHTRGFASPEQRVPRRHGEMDFRTDLYAVGVVGFLVVTGQFPYGPPMDPQQDARSRAGAVDTSALAASRAPATLQDVLVRLVQPSPNARFRTVQLARNALARCRP